MGHAASFNRHSAFASAGAAAASAAGGSGGGAAAGGAAAVGRGSGLDANTPPPSFYMASAVATKPSRLLVLPRQLLGRYGYLRAALPPFAEARREALLARRGQIKGTPANMVASVSPMMPAERMGTCSSCDMCAYRPRRPTSPDIAVHTQSQACCENGRRSIPPNTSTGRRSAVHCRLCTRSPHCG